MGKMRYGVRDSYPILLRRFFLILTHCFPFVTCPNVSPVNNFIQNLPLDNLLWMLGWKIDLIPSRCCNSYKRFCGTGSSLKFWTDALGVVLLQTDGNESTVVYASRLLKDAAINYSTVEREARVNQAMLNRQQERPFRFKEVGCNGRSLETHRSYGFP